VINGKNVNFHLEKPPYLLHIFMKTVWYNPPYWILPGRYLVSTLWLSCSSRLFV